MKPPVASLILLLSILAASAATDPTPVTLEDFHLVANLTNGQATFTLTATARVEDCHGGSLNLLSGPVALTEIGSHPKWRMRADQNRFVLDFERSGKFPVELKFTAAVRQADGWNTVDFHMFPSSLHPLVMDGLPEDTQFDFPGGARPERVGEEFKTFLPSDGCVKLSWKESRPAAEGKLFYAAEMLSQISVSPGLMRQVALLDFKVMQGELKTVALLLHGSGEVTRVQGDQVLAWNLEPVPGSTDRRLVVQFNQPQKEQFSLQVQLQTPLGAFPQTTYAMQLRPEAATRFAGYYRIVNDGAVRLEVAQASGLSQISPEQFPETDATRAALKPTGSQRFAYRFSGPDTALRIQADQILPELAVSELLAYRLGENELDIDGELELDIREAPLRELLLHVPKGYAVARLTAAGLSDYFVREPEGEEFSELRLVFSQPVSGHQLVQLRLERNKPLGETTWSLPRVEVARSKSVRGHIATAADAGFRLTPERTQSLTEIATAFFPRKVAGIQSAFRLSDPAWQAALRVERLPQTVQVDALHLFSIGEGIAYGSSVLNYVVSGAPVSVFKIELSDEYFNVEFTGKDIRNWQKTDGGYLVQLHTPVSGSYTLLASYERPFKAQGETLTFTGARPLDAQSEQGHTLIISAYQFQVKPVDVSAGLLPLETGEVPPEYRLFFDAPILSAYRYAARPFNLKLALSPLAQGDSLSQVVDRASLTTRISKEGQVIMDVRYFVKNRGNPNLRLSLPAGTELWTAMVNGAPVVPVTDAGANLIPLPQGTDPNAVLTLDLKLASRSKEPARVNVAAPLVAAPVMLAEWKLEPDTGQRLVYSAGSLTPLGGIADISGFAQLVRSFSGEGAVRTATLLLLGFAFVAAALVLWRWASRGGVNHSTGRYFGGFVLGVLALVLAVIAWLNFAEVLGSHRGFSSRDLTFLAPIQQAGTGLTVTVQNIPDKASAGQWLGYGWPVLLSLALFVFSLRAASLTAKRLCRVVAWAFLAWAALRLPNGAVVLAWLLVAFLLLEAVVPAFRQLLRSSPSTQPSAAPLKGGAASAATALLIGLCILTASLASGQETPAREPSHSKRQAVSQQITPAVLSVEPPDSQCVTSIVPDLVIQEIRIEDKFALASARIRWDAEKRDTLPLLFDPAVLTGISFPSNSLKFEPSIVGARSVQQLVAKRAGTFDIEIRYQLQVTKRGDETGLTLPLPFGVVNHVNLTAVNLDVDVLSPQAVSIQREVTGSNTVASLVLSPANNVWIGWKPRSRDVKSEKPVFYAEVSQLYVPAAGVVEGAHLVSIRPAQGQLSELILNVPPGATIIDVLDPAKTVTKERGATPASIVSLWRFDPDTRKLRVSLNPPQSRAFTLLVRSQIATGPLPLQQTVGLLEVDGAAGQLGLLALATGNEVQLDTVNGQSLSPINLEDFPADAAAALQAQIPNLTIRRAFRYSDTKASASLTASAVEPDVRVETQDTLSLGEDRTVLASSAAVEITRAGIFKLSFIMPPGFDVESISGPALSHWTESRVGADRVITLHLTGKTEGQQQFALSLAGSGVKATNNWSVPQLVLREAGKQRGTLLVVPEQGLRLQIASSDGLTQLDPQKSGIKQKGVLAFRVLQTPRSLALNIEQVDPWIQVASLQHATISEAQVKVTANLQYQIENTGLKAFRVFLPTNAEAVRFQGEQLADFIALPGTTTNGLQAWQIRLHRRVIGPYMLQASFQMPLPEKSSEFVLRGVQAADVNLQRGFVNIQSGGRLQVRIDSTPEALQPAEWQSIPRTLQQGLPANAANYCYRLVESSFELPLKLQRHDAARLLEAHVNSITFNSVISDDGVMLTQVHLDLLPGDKRLLEVTLPPNARFWFAFVNQNGVWPWRRQDNILVPLEQQSHGDKPVPVELFYSCQVGSMERRALDLELLAPKFDLPLENITWRVSLNDKWTVKHWSGSLQLQEQTESLPAAAADLQSYLQNEVVRQRERTKVAEDLLAAGNSALEKGDPQQARRSFQAAYGLSSHDAAFNEDARVQLHNIKLQQALIGLNVRQAASGGDSGALGGKLRDLRSRKELNYTQQDAKDILDRNSADENASYMKLAERLIQQQDAAVTSPAALRASIPDQGRVLTFKRAVLVTPWTDLKIDLRATAARTASSGLRLLILVMAVLLLGAFTWATRRNATN
jgi:hypothetical protein